MVETTREIGNILEENIELIFKKAGFNTKRNVRLSKYEIDVLAELDQIKIIIECKNYQNSTFTIRNLIHQWHSKNELINANKIILAIYGIKIKPSDKELASKFNIEILSEDDIDMLLTLLMKPNLLREKLLSTISFKLPQINEVYKDEIEKLIYYPILKQEEIDTIYNNSILAKALKIFIRTQLYMSGSEQKERENHRKLFEEREIIKTTFSNKNNDSDDAWIRIKKRLTKKKILSDNNQKEYLKLSSELDDEINLAIKYFKNDELEDRILRLIRARIIDSIKINDIPKFCFKDAHFVEVEAINNEDEETYFMLRLPIEDVKEIELINWTLTSERLTIPLKRDVEGRDVYIDYSGWLFNSLSETVEMIERIFYEYYGFEDDEELKDLSLLPAPTPKNGCFIATAAYGTPFAEEINVLRFWRDDSLKQNIFGKAFVKTYYLLSPPIANFISRHKSLRKIVRKMLNPIVKHFKQKYSK